MSQQAQQSATSAQTAQTAAEEAASIATEAAEKAEDVMADISAAEQAAAAAAESAQLAADSEDAAEASAAAALQSQNLAQGYANAANGSAIAAKKSEENAADSEEAAKTSETNAEASATGAAGSASAAAQSASAAADSASAASTSATQTKNYRDTAVESATQAADSASAAAESEGSAAASATQAGQAASAALSSAQDAASSATAAAGSAATASQQAIAADTSAEEASASATTSESWAVGGTGTRNGEDTDNAKYYAQLAQTVAQGAQGYFVTADALKAAHPSGQDGWWAIVGETDTIWIWDSDSGEWVDSSTTIDMSNYYTKSESDGRYATAAQGTLASTAVQPNDLAPYAKTADLPTAPSDIGAATAAQGAKADTAVQTVNNKSGTSITLGAADVGAATTAQGAKADTAVQPGDLTPYAKTDDLPDALPNPNSLTIRFNGVAQATYDGATARSVNITPSSIGAATSAQGQSADEAVAAVAELAQNDAALEQAIGNAYAIASSAMQPADGTHLYSATLLADSWTSAGSGRYTQTAALTPLTGGPAVTAGSVQMSDVMCNQTTVQATNETLQEVLGIINGGNTVLGTNQVTVTVFEVPEADVEAIWQIKQGVSG